MKGIALLGQGNISHGPSELTKCCVFKPKRYVVLKPAKAQLSRAASPPHKRTGVSAARAHILDLGDGL
eukprot:6597384-Prymnesium_polylepis.1